MEYWEFLLQKEGDRNWQPIKSPRIEIEAGRYRVVAHSTRTNSDVEICVIHDSTEEVPPKRRSQKRSRRTNPEGLMVVIPFTYLKPGLWELRCCGDIMSDFLGNSWQQSVQLQVLPKAAEVLLACEPAAPVVDDTQTDVQESLSEDSSYTSDPDQTVEPAPTEIEAVPLTPIAAEVAVPSDRDSDWEESSPIPPHLRSGPHLDEAELGIEDWEKSSPLPNPQSPIPTLQPATLADPVVPLEPTEPDEHLVALTGNSAEVAMPTNPILDQSLQMLEQILQQVLEPVLQEFERSESPESEIPVTAESELSLETGSNEQGLILTLDEDALVTRRGESLTIAGQVDVLDINQLNGSETSSAVNELFQGSLRYQLRDPQTSKVLLDVQQPLPEQALPLAFSHTLEIPPDCKSRLILGKVTLYGSTSRALASQPFSVTADLDELLGAIIPGTKVMPVAKMLVLANKLATSPENELEQPESPSTPLTQALLDLIDTSKSPESLPLQPASRQPLPPQIYQPAPTPRASKSLQLPKFPKVQPVATSAESSAAVSSPDKVEVKQEDPVEQPDDLSPEPPNSLLEDTSGEDAAPESQYQEAEHRLEEGISGDDTVTVADSSSSALVLSQLSDSPVTVADSEQSISNATETPEHSQSTADSPISDSDAIAGLDETQPEKQLAKPVADNRTAVDNAFQALKLQDRFWLRLNSLAADAELSEWLRSEIPSSSNPADEVEVRQQLNSDTPLPDLEEVTQQLNSEQLIADFDESIWEEETEEFGSAIADLDQLQPPPLEESTQSTSLEVEMPAQQPLVNLANKDWAAQEIVVEDEEFPALEQPQVRHDASGMPSQTRQLDPHPEPRSLSPQQLESPVPAPTIFVPTKELAAGEPVIVRVKLPLHSVRLCVKLWLQDRQSRSLLDGPRWLMDLLPDGSGELEAMTQLTIPFGSAEIRFEAIAVDIYSQRESHKVMVDCVVVPPDLPNISLDDFEA